MRVAPHDPGLEPAATGSPRTDEAPSSGVLGSFFRFVLLTVRKARRDDLIQQSAALAFVTIFSLVPLLAAFSYVGAEAFADDQQHIVELLSQLLPYSEETILTRLEEFLDAARGFRDVGFVLFLLTALAVFSTVEETINRIWNVARRRRFRSRLLSFTLVVFWGPLVIGATYSGLFFLEKQPAFQTLVRSVPVQLLPFVVTVLGLSMLNWMVPYTAVRFRSALVGGLTAAVLLEGLRQGFGLYVEMYRRISVIYGSFGLVLLFLASIQLAWWIVLLGSETAYCLENFRLLAHPRRSAAALEGGWLALAALVVVTDRFRRGKPITPHELLAERLRLSGDDLPRVLEPLVEQRLLVETGGDDEGYLLACDPYQLRIDALFAPYEELHREILERLDHDLASRLQQLRDRLAGARGGELGTMTLAELLAAGAAAEDVATAPLDLDPATAGDPEPELAAPDRSG